MHVGTVPAVLQYPSGVCARSLTILRLPAPLCACCRVINAGGPGFGNGITEVGRVADGEVRQTPPATAQIQPGSTPTLVQFTVGLVCNQSTCGRLYRQDFESTSLCCCGALPHLIVSASSAGVKVVAVTLYVVCRRDSLGAVISAQVA
jgi:hypothetical protein